MITRLMLSLKKAASGPTLVRDPNHPSQTVESVRFAQQTIGGTEYVGDITRFRMERARFSHRVVSGAGSRSDIAMKHISTEGRVSPSNGYD